MPSSLNKIELTLNRARDSVRIEMLVPGRGALFINFDTEEFDNLLMNLHRIRGEMASAEKKR